MRKQYQIMTRKQSDFEMINATICSQRHIKLANMLLYSSTILPNKFWNLKTLRIWYRIKPFRIRFLAY